MRVAETGMPGTAGGAYEFGPFRLDVGRHVLTHNGQPIPLTPKTFDLLLLLARHQGRAFSRRDLMSALWPDTSVEDGNLSFQVHALRKALGEDGARWIETVPKFGYRFTADVREAAAAPGAASQFDGPSSSQPVIASSRGRRIGWWFVPLAAGVALAGVSWLAWDSQAGAARGSRALVAEPLTAYPGFERSPSLAPDASQVAFEWNGPAQDNLDIYVKPFGTADPVRLTTDLAPDMSPAWSPAGDRIAFLRLRSGARADLVVTSLPGRAERVVATVQSGVSYANLATTHGLTWTPDGQWLIVSEGLDARAPGLWAVSVDGLKRQQLTASPAPAYDTDPQFSPDGRWLAFVRRGGNVSVIQVLPVAAGWTPGGAPRRVTDSPAVNGLAWSPDGADLVFSGSGHFGIPRLSRARRVVSSDTPQVDVLPFGAEGRTLSIGKTGRLVFAAGFRDTNLHELTLAATADGPATLPGLASTFDEHAPDVSPDGRQVAFSSNRTGWEEIWIANRDGSNPRQVTSCRGPVCSNPRWSPDGRTILFGWRQSGSSDLYRLQLETGQMARLTDHPGSEIQPSWSRDGRSIYFASSRTGRFEIWRMPATGGSAVQLTRHGGLSPVEGRDGYVYYAKSPTVPTALWRVPLGGGPETAAADRLAYVQNFVAGERGVYLMAVAPQPDRLPVTWITPGPTLVDYIDYATGTRQTLARFDKTFSVGMVLTPDERSLIVSLVESAGSNLMFVEGFR